MRVAVRRSGTRNGRGDAVKGLAVRVAAFVAPKRATAAATPRRALPCAWRRSSLRGGQRPRRRREEPCRARGVRGCVRRRVDPKAGFVRLWRRAKRPCARCRRRRGRRDAPLHGRRVRRRRRGRVFRFEATEPRSEKKGRRGGEVSACFRTGPVLVSAPSDGCPMRMKQAGSRAPSRHLKNGRGFHSTSAHDPHEGVFA